MAPNINLYNHFVSSIPRGLYARQTWIVLPILIKEAVPDAMSFSNHNKLRLLCYYLQDRSRSFFTFNCDYDYFVVLKQTANPINYPMESIARRIIDFAANRACFTLTIWNNLFTAQLRAAESLSSTLTRVHHEYACHKNASVALDTLLEENLRVLNYTKPSKLSHHSVAKCLKSFIEQDKDPDETQTLRLNCDLVVKWKEVLKITVANFIMRTLKRCNVPPRPTHGSLLLLSLLLLSMVLLLSGASCLQASGWNPRTNPREAPSLVFIAIYYFHSAALFPHPCNAFAMHFRDGRGAQDPGGTMQRISLKGSPNSGYCAMVTIGTDTPQEVRMWFVLSQWERLLIVY